MLDLPPYRDHWTIDDPHANFKAEVAAYSITDPLPTLDNLSKLTGIPTLSLIRYILVKYAASPNEALLAMEPIVFRQLKQKIADAESAGSDEARLAAYHSLREIITWLGTNSDDGLPPNEA
ncbi:MAG: DUF6027 family protein [Verrucomicrobiota bacterium]|nr:DUF6027 family protein [Verrucomicrobiota bacterium]